MVITIGVLLSTQLKKSRGKSVLREAASVWSEQIIEHHNFLYKFCNLFYYRSK